MALVGFAGLVAATLLLSASANAQVDGGYRYGYGNPGIPGYPPPGQCTAQPHEIECLHITLELILKVAVSEYVSRHPELRSQAPWFDAFQHVTIPPGAFTNTCLSLLSSIEIRESLQFCFETGGSHNRTYVPPSPVHMYRDLCLENAAIQEQLDKQLVY